MALSLVLKSQSRAQLSAILSNVARMSTVTAVSPIAKISEKKHFSLAKPILVNHKPLSLLNHEQIRSIALSTPKMSAAGGSHTTLWTAERALSVGLLGLVPAAIACPSQVLDTLLAISVVMHGHWGLEACVTDYIRPVIFGELVAKSGHVLLLIISATTLGGLLYFIYTDIGIANAIRKLWAIKGQ